MKKKNIKTDAELADLMYAAREGLMGDQEMLLDGIVGHLIEDGLNRDQIHLFLETLLYVEHLPN